MTKRIIKPSEFFQHWLNIFSSQVKDIPEREVETLWNSNKAWTTLVFGDGPDKGLVNGIGKSLDLLVSAPHWTLDAVFYEQELPNPRLAGFQYAEYISVAFEHENDAGTVEEEMNKLTLINAPLKVLVTYPGMGSRGRDRVTKPALLSTFSEIIRKADFLEDGHAGREHLIIFGEMATNSPRILWEAYRYRDGNFEKIIPKVNLPGGRNGP